MTILFRILLFLLPLVFFFIIVKFLRARAKGEELDEGTLRLLRYSVVALFATLALATFWRLTHDGTDPSMTYIPPHVVDGEVQPGHFEPKDPSP